MVFLDPAAMTGMRHRRRLQTTAIAVLAACVLATAPVTQRGPTAPTAPPTPTAPRLLVLLVVDQFRADYLDWYGAQWTGGLHRLRTMGAVYPRATIPYAITKTCAGHASISTGAPPAAHGLIDNDWYDSSRRSFVGCTADEAARPIGLGGQDVVERHSAAALNVPTLGDELRRQARQPPRILSLALKARAAISLGGHGGPGTVIFWEEDSGHWATSTAFASTAWKEVSESINQRPHAAARGQLWHRLLPPDRYVDGDDAPGEPSPATFPHSLHSPSGAPSAYLWDASPLSDRYLGELAGTLSERLALGQRDATDLLAIGFSALDYVGHSYGPRSHEVQDVLARLDVVLGRLFDTLDRTVGADKYVVAFSSDHGVALLPEQAASLGAVGGRLSVNALGVAIESALRGHFGPRPFIEAMTGTYVHFLPGVLDAIQGNALALRGVEAAALAVPGVERVLWSTELSSSSASDATAVLAMRRSYFAGRSGDLAFQPKPHWVVASAGTNHGSWHAYDREVPVIFLGANVKSGRQSGVASPLDVAPTLAALAGITMPRGSGRPLVEIISK
jgi:Type I phosphodiesterase / nucleotide pyrophosphatase